MTISEENYIKVIYHLTVLSANGVSTNAIAGMLNTKASSVTEMLKKLAEKQLLVYQKYQGVQLTKKGLLSAKMIIRKHRLWEVFLVDKLHFAWDEVHEIAEELEHIKSEKLINSLDKFLNFPDFDPHGDPIPDENGAIKKVNKLLLADGNVNISYTCIGVKDSSAAFLQYLDKQKIALGSKIKISHKEDFDDTITLSIDDTEMTISNKTAINLYVV